MKNKFRLAKTVFLTALLAVAASVALDYLAFIEIQKRLEISVQGQFMPEIFDTAFRLTNASFNWEDKVRVTDGSVRVRFDIGTLIAGKGLRVMVQSSSAKLEFLGDWALQQGVKATDVGSLEADVILGRHGLAGINAIDVQAPNFQFSIKNAVEK